ncbi:hypothetical protein BATDEDRAFT_90388 [Batrachochytrium dendrobatidis JAM81]|uniref:NodB homology domain-containing protein n=1 Tax=Batrachochytrium dendrobatidis (strain JAM81 / FGSC 10211) TaxID=684364 RepID=F4P7N3_BATDJ|nr:uncharacterized protein BATDEDRAFT_90388 [Batrachochytrium dendrobatidis JAM81]EGF78635.1 hypothetical protein BATDEDRAFT_90388 [Batrachochytrium dendrobatidis JAM81]|eukprot:XP_006680920.1 hypothetical protein BATDEDRAFT_90388 [Batrachochytrium dendrobatidis JAM81]
MISFWSLRHTIAIACIAALQLSDPFVLAQEGAGVSGPTTVTTGYSCDPAKCKLPACYCPSTKPPGGLDPKNIPQLITLTFDDSINEVILPQILNYTSDYTNPNGCPLAATFFISTQYTDFWHVNRMYSSGHEIATHTINHVGDPPLGEMSGAVQAVSAFGGVPLSKLVGFRTPFLLYSRNTYANLITAGTFKYDSSMPMNYGAIPAWPYTLDNGPYTQCSGGTCVAPFNFPGLWEIPMYMLLNADGTENAAMDPDPLPKATPGPMPASDIFDLLKTNFNNRYTSTRLPLGIYLHAAVAVTQPNYITGVRMFMDWIRSSGHNDVYWVSNQQLLAWMQNPTDIAGSVTNPALDCLMPAVNPSNAEVCDGIDNNGNGQIDEGLTESCYYPALQASFTSCFGCPTTIPNVTNPVPFTGPRTRKSIPSAGCPNGGTWNPISGTCVNLARQAKVIPKNSTGSGSSAKGAGNSADSPSQWRVVSLIVTLATLFFVGMAV